MMFATLLFLINVLLIRTYCVCFNGTQRVHNLFSALMDVYLYIEDYGRLLVALLLLGAPLLLALLTLLLDGVANVDVLAVVPKNT